MQKITPFLWFDDNAEEAVRHYTSIFKDSEVTSVHRFGDQGPDLPAPVLSVSFRLAGQAFIALNGGPQFRFTPAISLFVDCDSQGEVDMLWERLSEGGEKQRCGWLRDKFGVSWQVIPAALGRMLRDPDDAKSGRVMQAMRQMDKIDIQALTRAFERE